MTKNIRFACFLGAFLSNLAAPARVPVPVPEPVSVSVSVSVPLPVCVCVFLGVRIPILTPTHVDVGSPMSALESSVEMFMSSDRLALTPRSQQFYPIRACVKLGVPPKWLRSFPCEAHFSLRNQPAKDAMNMALVSKHPQHSNHVLLTPD